MIIIFYIIFILFIYFIRYILVLKKLDKLSEEMNSRDELYINNFIALKKAQKSNFIPKNKPFPKKTNDEGKQSSSKFLTL